MPPDVSSSESGPSTTIELATIPPPDASTNIIEWDWHPKLTAARLLVIVSTLGLGTAKAVTSFQHHTVAPIALEWVAGVVIFYLSFIFSKVENREAARPQWFFKKDFMDFVWAIGRLSSWRTPRYRSEERPSALLIKPRRPPVTGYRILVSICVVSFGMAKAGLSYSGKEAAPTAVEWVFGVFVSLSLYGLGLYEMSSENVLPWLFETDYSSSVLGGGAVLVIVLLHLAAIAGSGGWTYLWYSSIVDQWNGNTPTETGDQRRFGMSPILFKVYWTLISSVMGVGIGVVAGCVALFSLSGIVGPPLLELTWQASQSVRMFVRRSSGGEEEDQHIYRNFNEWYTSLTLPDFLAYPSPALQMLYTCILVVLGILLYLLAHAMAGALAAGWTLLWFSGLSSIWEVRADLSWYIAPFIVLWGVGACIAMALGTMGCIYILVAFFSPLGGRGHLFLPTPGFNYKRL